MLNIYQTKKSKLDQEIQDVLDALSEIRVNSDEYAEVLSRLKTLYEIRNSERKFEDFSKDTLLLVGGNLIIAILVLKHEEFNVITTKVGGFLMKGRV